MSCNHKCCVLQNQTVESACHIMESMQKLDPQILWHRYVIDTVCPQIVPLVCKTSCSKSSTVRELACPRNVLSTNRQFHELLCPRIVLSVNLRSGMSAKSPVTSANSQCGYLHFCKYVFMATLFALNSHFSKCK